MRENIFQQIVACTWWKDGQIDLIFNENKNEFLSRRCHQQMEEKLQVSHLADLTACFATMLEVVRAGYPLNFRTSRHLRGGFFYEKTVVVKIICGQRY